ncbi:sodium-coupled monocarboxylate transporter 1-like isoform X2 [Bradysia coprophila]|uniref:sodium-coupled monocarboxylate transporter 1-like isoform X2 n=1 Tax=Bradysia coprophila TaxID=38358 RepID=UPI00187DB266|nr:sodium-coupled monocarboxylate transporter 1-like isoform X2 [Bradysia coprophila]
MRDIDQKIDINDMNKSLQLFGWVDYIVFLLMLIACALVGVYYGFIERKFKKKTMCGEGNGSEDVAQEYLMGGRQMAVIPVSLSLVASWISGISLLGLATEMYLYGTSYAFVLITLVISAIFFGIIYLPVFYNLQLTSLSEYLEMRFDKRMRILGSILYIIGALAYLPVVIYVPALAFNQVTGVNIHIVTPFVCVICIFYTLVGGIKAVVCTDCIQTVVMIGSMLLIIVKGTIDMGGFQTVWSRNLEGERLDFPELTLDLKVRHSVLSLLAGGVPYYITTCFIGQSMTQRYLSLPTLRKANYALVIFAIVLATIMAICCYSGMLVYALYRGCDPLKTKLINAPDQLLPLLVMNLLGSFPGLPGLFVAGIFSASLSSLSTFLNSMAAIVLEDFYKPFASRPLSEKQTSYLMRSVVFCTGVIALALVFVVEKLGTVLQLSMSLTGMVSGPTFGMFTMGLLCPWVHKRGAFTGAIAGILSMIWVLANAQSDIATGELTFTKKPLTTDECEYDFTNMLANSTTSSNDTNRSITFPTYFIRFLVP